MAALYGHVLGEATRRAEAHPPAAAGAQLFIAFATLSTRAVSPAGIHHDHVALGVPHRLRHLAAQSRYSAGDLMARDIGELHWEGALEVAVVELVVASAHAASGDLQENLRRARLGHRNFIDPKRLLVSVHPGRLHLHVILHVLIDLAVA